MSKSDDKAGSEPITLPAEITRHWLRLVGLVPPPRCKKHATTPTFACPACRLFHGHIDTFRRQVAAAESRLHEIVNSTRARGPSWRFVDDEPVRKVETALAVVNKETASLREMFADPVNRPSLDAPEVLSARSQLASKVRDLLKAARPTKEPRRNKGGPRGRPRGSMGIDGTTAGERCAILLYYDARRFGGSPGIAKMSRFLRLLKRHLPQHVQFPNEAKLDRLMRERRARDGRKTVSAYGNKAAEILPNIGDSSSEQ